MTQWCSSERGVACPSGTGAGSARHTHVFVLARMDQLHESLDDLLFIKPLKGKQGCRWLCSHPLRESSPRERPESMCQVRQHVCPRPERTGSGQILD